MWGGSRLRPGVVPTAEAWIVYAGSRITSGPYAGRTLADISLEFGMDLLGSCLAGGKSLSRAGESSQLQGIESIVEKNRGR